MKIFLAGNGELHKVMSEIKDYDKCPPSLKEYKPFILESFFYVNSDTEKLLPIYGDFMLDSGAFTFMQGKREINWDEFLEKYSDYIKRNDIKKFFELDIDYNVGYPRVVEMRKKLESMTGKQCIPVWHKPRGIDEFKRMCDEYPYVAIGASGKNEDSAWVKTRPDLLKRLVDMAHERDAKIHGLGYTNFKLLPTIGFDSVDSTTWCIGSKYGKLCKFDGHKIKKYSAPEGKRLKPNSQSRITLINYIEWIKYQQYMERSF